MFLLRALVTANKSLRNLAQPNLVVLRKKYPSLIKKQNLDEKFMTQFSSKFIKIDKAKFA